MQRDLRQPRPTETYQKELQRPVLEAVRAAAEVTQKISKSREASVQKELISLVEKNRANCFPFQYYRT